MAELSTVAKSPRTDWALARISRWLGYPAGSIDSPNVVALPCESSDFHRSKLCSGNSDRAQGPSMTNSVNSMDNSLGSLRTIEEICSSGAAELDESAALLLSTIFSHPGGFLEPDTQLVFVQITA
jgi:hypothetical protein